MAEATPRKLCRSRLHLMTEDNVMKDSRCRECRNARARARYAKEPVKTTDYNKKWRKRNRANERRRHYWKQYGLTEADVDELRKKQRGCCAICGIKEAELKDKIKVFNIDHDHVDNKNRGLLCDSCNHGLGNFKDSPRLLLAALTYLKKYEQLKLVDLKLETEISDAASK